MRFAEAPDEGYAVAKGHLGAELNPVAYFNKYQACVEHPYWSYTDNLYICADFYQKNTYELAQIRLHCFLDSVHCRL